MHLKENYYLLLKNIYKSYATLLRNYGIICYEKSIELLAASNQQE